MAQAIKAENDTYLDASGVMMRAPSNDYRKTLADWGSGIVGMRALSVAQNSSATFNVENGARIFLFAVSADSSNSGYVGIFVNNTGTAYIRGQLGMTNVTFDTNTANKLKISTTGNQISLLALCRNGDITAAS